MQSAPSSYSQPVASTERDETRLIRKHACVACYSRKVKCNRVWPCSTCDKGKVECIYRDPAPPRRKKRMTEADLLDRITRYEDHLRKAGIAIDSQQARNEQSSPEADAGSAVPRASPASHSLRDATAARLHTSGPRPRSPATAASTSRVAAPWGLPAGLKTDPETSSAANAKQTDENGRLVTDSQGHTRYVNSGLWMALHKELPDPASMIQEGAADSASDDETNSVMDPAYLLFSGGSAMKTELANYYPPPARAQHLWNTYVRSVMPIGRFVHYPTFHKTVELAQNDIRSVSINKLTLLYCIFLMSITAMDEGECLKHFGQGKGALKKHYQFLAQHGLMKTHFLRSADIDVLTAYVHYLLAMRLDFDSHSLWALTGVAFRIARRIGLHKDGSALGLSPFETEMRRRLWFQLVVLDFTSAELAGLMPEAGALDLSSWGTRQPLNLNDSDLDPEMKQMPPERVGATEMIFTMMRNEFKGFFQHAAMMTEKAKKKREERANNEMDGKAAEDFLAMLKEKDQFIDSLEKKLEENVLRFCDPLEPLHYLTSIATRTAIAGMRLRAHHPRQYADGGASMPQAEKDLLFSTSSKIISYFNLVHLTPLLKGFLWHIKVYFQWHSLIYVLCELRHRTSGPEVDKAWENLVAIFENLPSILLSPKYVLHAAIISLTLTAWECREAELQKTKTPYRVPDLVPQLRNIQTNKRSHRNQSSRGSGQSPMNDSRSQANNMNFSGAGHNRGTYLEAHNSRSFNVPAPFWSQAVEQTFGSVPSATNLDPLGSNRQSNYALGAGIMPYRQPGGQTADGSAIGSTPSSAFNLPTPENWAQWDHLLKGTDMTANAEMDVDGLFWAGQIFS